MILRNYKRICKDVNMIFSLNTYYYMWPKMMLDTGGQRQGSKELRKSSRKD